MWLADAYVTAASLSNLLQLPARTARQYVSHFQRGGNATDTARSGRPTALDEAATSDFLTVTEKSGSCAFSA